MEISTDELKALKKHNEQNIIAVGGNLITQDTIRYLRDRIKNLSIYSFYNIKNTHKISGIKDVLKLIFLNPKNVLLLQDTERLKLFCSCAFPNSRILILKNSETSAFNQFKYIHNKVKTDLLGVFTKIARQLNTGPHRYLKGTNNDYTFLEKKTKYLYLPVTIVIPVYNRKEILRKTLTAIELQNYPKSKMNIIIADDGSTDNVSSLKKEFKTLKIKVVRQKHEDFGASRVRNKAILKSKTDIIILLDCDMLPEINFVREHIKWFSNNDENIVVVGNRKYISTNNIQPKDIKANYNVIRSQKEICAPYGHNVKKDWRISIIKSTNMLKDCPEPYKVCCTGNLSFQKKYAMRAGLFDENFKFWGGEDIEFGYRMYKKGSYFIPDNTCLAYHQDHAPAVDRVKHHIESRKLLGKKIPAYRIFAKNKFISPKVSIYIICYNSERYILDCIQSALNQKFNEAFEIVIVNDGSTDNTERIINTISKNNDKIRYYKIKHAGIAQASNFAVSHCQGEYVAQLDSDDILKNNAIQKLSDYLDQNKKIGLVYSQHDRIDEKDKIVRLKVGSNYSNEILMKGCIVQHFRMFRSQCWYRTEGYDVSLFNAVDYDMMIKLSEVCAIAHYPVSLYKYRVHSDGTSVKHKLAQLKNHEICIKKAIMRRRNAKYKIRI